MIIPIEDNAHWKRLRQKHIGSSDVACLFDASPYKTQWILWNEKTGRVEGPDRDDNRKTWGKRLEPAIAAGLAEDMDWTIVSAAKEYYASDEHPVMGCTLDYRVVDHEWGPGVVEIKSVDWKEWKDKWTDTRAPDWVELQVQHQLATTKWSWGVIGALVGGNDLKVYERRPIASAAIEIEQRCNAFWTSVVDVVEPDPYGTAVELDVLKMLFPREDPKKTISPVDPALDAAAGAYLVAAEQEGSGKKARERWRVQLLHAMGDAHSMILQHHWVTRTVTKAGAIRLIVREAPLGMAYNPMSPVDPRNLEAG